MPGVLKISERASLALHAMAYLASRPEEVQVTVKGLAGALSGSEAHLAKVLQGLARGGMLKGTRGPTGGYRLARAPAAITLLQVTEAVEGPLDVRSCLIGTPICQGKKCLLGDTVHGFNRRLRDHLAETTVADLSHLFADKTTKSATRKRKG